MLASVWAGEGADVRYVTSASWAADSRVMRASMTIGSVSPSVHKLLAKRRLPPSLTRSNTRRKATRTAVLFEIVSRFAPARRGAVLHRLLAEFDRQVAHDVATDSPDILICQYQSAKMTFEAADPSVLRVLNYPIAHHRWMQREFDREHRDNPSWAAYLEAFGSITERGHVMDAEIHLADIIVVPSSFARDTFLAEGVEPHKLAVVPLASTFETGDQRTSYRESGPLEILFVGQVSQRKGLSYLVDALNSLSDDDFRLTIVGRPVPGVREQFESVHTAGQTVRWVPSLSRRELSKEMMRADVLVLPSLAEGFGLVVAEAMSVGTPVIASDHSVGHDLIRDGQDGFVVPARSSAALRECLLRLHADPKHSEEMGRNAVDRARDLSWSRYASRMKSVVSVGRGPIEGENRR